MKTIIILLMATTLFSCYDPDPIKLKYQYKSYDDIIKVFDIVGRQNPVEYKELDSLYWLITFSNGQTYKITGYTKGMICRAMPQHC